MMKKSRVILMVLVAVVLAAGTVFERYRGAEWVAEHFYGSWWFAVLMGLVAVGSLTALKVKGDRLMLKGGKKKSLFSISNSQISIYLIHVSIPIILLGGALTTWTGEHYSITLSPGETKEGITLERFEVIYYPGTHTPMDFVSHVTVADGSAVRKADISMNHILRHDGRRYYQEDYDDEGRTTLSVSHDPWGIPVTYTGYAILLLGLGWLMIKGLEGTIVKTFFILLIFNFQLSIFNSAQAAPRTLPRETASKMGEMYVLYKGRVCPVQTFAKDFSTKLTGKATYEGLTSEQVLAGFIFYYSDWAPVLDEVSHKRQKESKALVEMILSGHGLKLFPLADKSGALDWYAQNDILPVTVSDGEYIFIRKHLSYCQELVVKGDYGELERVFGKIRLFQEKRAYATLPSPAKVKAERLYNAFSAGRWLAMLAVTVGMLAFIGSLVRRQPCLRGATWRIAGTVYLSLMVAWLMLLFVMRWVVGGHVPMAGGYDTMNLMALVAGIIGLVFSIKQSSNQAIKQSSAMLALGFCLLVAMMSGSNPPVTNLMPVLNSPLLALHVAVIMCSYALFFIIALFSVASLHGAELEASLHALLRPAVFLLALGIAIGAVWANISWGNYWSWDPKEVWALITLIVYALPLHPGLFRSGRALCLYCALAFLSVAVTYFGVNLLLGGMHAYN